GRRAREHEPRSKPSRAATRTSTCPCGSARAGGATSRCSTGSGSNKGASTLRLTEFVDRFPELSETFVTSEIQALRRLGHDVHVESLTRAPRPNAEAAAGIEAAYAEDDGRRAKLSALAWLVRRHPLRSLGD